MKFAFVFIVFLFAFFSLNVGAVNDNGRFIAHGLEVGKAVEKGCKVVREVKDFNAVVCNKKVAEELSLKEDVKVFALDSKANSQTKANLVHSSGNSGAGRKLVILDTGYNYLHAELQSSYLGGKDFVNNDNDPFDDNGHGTHVAGIITADGVDSNARGIAPDVGIISGKVLAADGSGYFSDVAAAIYWAVDGQDGIFGTSDDFNADAISLSLGTSKPYVYKGYCDSVMPDLTNAINYAVGKNVAVVVAAGNDGKAGVSVPGCISFATTVGAVNFLDKIASFSGNGKAVDIVAPGVGIYSTWLGNGYSSLSGTSMATPMVSGVVALIKASKPGYSVQQVENALFKTSKDLGRSGFDSTFGWGRVDAYGAVNYVG